MNNNIDNAANKQLADLLFPHIDKTPEDYENLYPRRNLPEGAKVTRIGPSPTGFVHLGNLYNAIIGERLAHQSGGVFFLRVEDTDAKREVEGAVELVLSSMAYFGISFDEGVTENDGTKGEYGPYRQRLRKDIYQAIAKRLVEMGYAYPCFCSEDKLTEMREKQISQKLNFGYYGEWAACRNLSYDEVKTRIENGEEYVLRFRSMGHEENHVDVYDAIRGTLTLQENYQDFVLLKSDGIPTYHFAHVVDDHFMRTTHVVRGEEWLSTLPMHVQAFDALGWERPVFCHTTVLMKMDGDTKRKLSKRKDPELGLGYYRAEGYLPEAVWEYLLTVLNSNYEEWRMENPVKDIDEFMFTTEKMSTSGALFDMMKFDDISREIIFRMTPDEIYEKMSAWLLENNKEFYDLFTRDAELTKKAINVGRDAQRPRKDLTNWRQAAEFLSIYYDESLKMVDSFPENVSDEDRKEIIDRYLSGYNHSDDNSEWFQKIRDITEDMGYAAKPKDYKKNPEMYKGSITDVSNVIRVALTGKTSSPDLWEICHIIGEDSMRRRIESAKN